MAQPAKILVDWIGGILAEAGNEYQASDIPTEADIVEIRSETANLSIDGTDAFPMKYGEQIIFEATRKYIFTDDCKISYGTIVAI